MKKQMKKVGIFLAVTALAIGCKKNEVLQSQLNSDLRIKTIASGGDGKWDLLGYGLDAAGDLLNPSSISDAPIFDMEKFERDFRARIDINTTTEGTERYFGGASAYDYMRDVSTSKSFDVNGNATIKGTNSSTGQPANDLLNFTGSIKKNSSDQSINSYSSRYAYASYEVSQRIKRLRFTDDVNIDQLIKYLTPEFVNNVAVQNADYLVNRYGTHVMLDISIGGRLSFNFSGAISNESDYDKNTKAVKVGLGFSLLKIIGVNISSDKTKEEITKIVNETRSKEYTGKFYGGTNSGRSISIDNDGNSSETINMASWQQSITDRNAALIAVGKTIFLYDLITDPIKKASVKAAVERHIKNSQLSILPTEVYEFYNSRSNRHASALDPNMHDKYPGSGWQPNDQSFKAYPFSYYSTVPIYQFFSELYNDRILTTNINFSQASYRYDGIMFYGYASQMPGTVPVYQFSLSQGGPDHFYNPDPNAAIPFPGWKRDGVAFWAYRN
ncbi:MAC/perforin domain-containing protein [Sphingobacterium thalpophilum]|uniref:MAC/perforin domain-containing protein n=1 Tax=Sphingobacterium thalpophilum TaxID=259 RepID=UPI0037DA2D99